MNSPYVTTVLCLCVTILFAQNSNSLAIQAESEQAELNQDQTENKKRFAKLIGDIRRVMLRIDSAEEQLRGEQFFRQCSEIWDLFSSVERNKIPKDIEKEFKLALDKFTKFYGLLKEVKNKDLDQMRKHVGDSAPQFKQAWDALVKKAVNSGYAIEGLKKYLSSDPEISATLEKLDLLHRACNSFKIDVESYPTALEDLLRTPNALKGKRMWRGPYVAFKDVFFDSWGTKFEFTVDKDSGEITIKSAGPDKKFGTADDLKD